MDYRDLMAAKDEAQRRVKIWCSYMLYCLDLVLALGSKTRTIAARTPRHGPLWRVQRSNTTRLRNERANPYGV
jgi:hypothetical protein